MKTYDFKVNRRMDGDRAYQEGDVRTLAAHEAVHLVRSGALEPKTAEGKKAMADLLGTTAAPTALGVQAAPAVTDAAMDANNARAAADGASPTPVKSGQTSATVRTADAGNAERNKADVAQPVAPGMVAAGDPGAETVEADPAAVPAALAAPAPVGAAVEGSGTTAAPARTAAPAKAAADTGKPKRRR